MKRNKTCRVYITGTPGTGKTSIAKILVKELDLLYIEINELVLNEGYFIGYDVDRDTVIIDDDLLIPVIEDILETNPRICLVGGVLPLKDLFDIIYVIRCRADILRERLKSRNYTEEKIEANIEAEIMDIVFLEMIDNFPSNKIMSVSNDIQSAKDA